MVSLCIMDWVATWARPGSAQNYNLQKAHCHPQLCCVYVIDPRVSKSNLKYVHIIIQMGLMRDPCTTYILRYHFSSHLTLSNRMHIQHKCMYSSYCSILKDNELKASIRCFMIHLFLCTFHVVFKHVSATVRLPCCTSLVLHLRRKQKQEAVYGLIDLDCMNCS